MRGVGRRFGLMSKECSRTGRVEDPGSRRKGRSTAHQARETQNILFERLLLVESPHACQSDTDRCRFNATNRTSRETTASQGKTRREQGNAMAYVPLYQDRRPGYVS